MTVKICKWYRDAVVPVVLMVDYWAGNSIKPQKNELSQRDKMKYSEEDKNSALEFLQEEVLKDFPEMRATIFIADLSNSNLEDKHLLRILRSNTRYEAAYLGAFPPKPIKDNSGGLEKEVNGNREQEPEYDEYGKEIFREVIGIYPAGGRYYNYAAGDYYKDSIEENEFSWWCRPQSSKCNTGERIIVEDYNPLTINDIKFFGNTKVADIPITVPGSLFNNALQVESAKNLKSIIKKHYNNYLIEKNMKKLDFLVNNGLVVSISESITSAKINGSYLPPSIYNDHESLQMIFKFLKPYHVWYCTCSEMAEYARAREAAYIKKCTDKSFYIFTDPNYDEDSTITLKVNNPEIKYLELPIGKYIPIKNQLVDIKVESGFYSLQ